MDKVRVVYRLCHLCMDYILIGKLENFGIRAIKKIELLIYRFSKKKKNLNIWTFRKSSNNVLLLYIRTPSETEVFLNNLLYSEYKIMYWSYLILR